MFNRKGKNFNFFLSSFQSFTERGTQHSLPIYVPHIIACQINAEFSTQVKCLYVKIIKTANLRQLFNQHTPPFQNPCGKLNPIKRDLLPFYQII